MPSPIYSSADKLERDDDGPRDIRTANGEFGGYAENDYDSSSSLPRRDCADFVEAQARGFHR